MINLYILQGKKTKLCTDILIWSKYRERPDSQIARTTGGKVVVSTVFIGLDYSFYRRRPLLFEWG